MLFQALLEHRWLEAVFSLVVAAGFGYATLVLVGPGASWEDAMRPLRARVGGLSPRRARSTSLDENPRHW